MSSIRAFAISVKSPHKTHHTIRLNARKMTNPSLRREKVSI